MTGTKTLVQLVLCSSLCLAAAPLAHAGPPVITLDVTGPASNPGKQERCMRVAQKMGFVLSPSAPVRVMLILQMGTNRLQINSVRRGEVFNAARPPWGMEELCRDAMQQAQTALSQEGQPPVAPPPPQYAPPPPQQYTPPPPQYAVPPPAPGAPPVFSLEVGGPSSNPGKQERCFRVAQRMGVTVAPGAPFRVILTLIPGVNKLQVISARRGELLATARPPWGMEQLCEDAVRTGLNLYAQEGQAPVRVGPPPPRPEARPAPVMALGPIPPGGDLPPGAKAIADRAVAAWSAARFEAALNEFREAARVHADPQFLFDQAVCEQRLGRVAEALTHVQHFIDRAPQSPYRPYADQLVGELHAQNGPQ